MREASTAARASVWARVGDWEVVLVLEEGVATAVVEDVDADAIVKDVFDCWLCLLPMCSKVCLKTYTRVVERCVVVS